MVAQNGTAVSLEAVYDYYPYGAVMRSYENSPANMRLYQGKEWHDQLALNWYDFGSRYYDPVLGMWGSVDPQKQFASPYLAMGNNPVMMADPDGEWAFLAFVLGSGILKGIFNATKDGGWSWKDFGKGFLQGAALSAAMVGSFYVPGAVAGLGINGALPAAGVYGASAFASSALQSGITSWAFTDKFKVDWKSAGISGGISALFGGLKGYLDAKQLKVDPWLGGQVEPELIASVNYSAQGKPDVKYHSSDVYRYDGHYQEKSQTFRLKDAGAYVEVKIKNNNPIQGVVFDIHDQSMYYYKENWITRLLNIKGIKTFEGMQYNGRLLLQLQSGTYRFVRHVYEPINWTFMIQTHSDLANLGIEFYSTFVPSMKFLPPPVYFPFVK